MEKIKLKQTDGTPAVLFDGEKGVFEKRFYFSKSVEKLN